MYGAMLKVLGIDSKLSKSAQLKTKFLERQPIVGVWFGGMSGNEAVKAFKCLVKPPHRGSHFLEAHFIFARKLFLGIIYAPQSPPLLFLFFRIQRPRLDSLIER
jgi:hypothetical protein